MNQKKTTSFPSVQKTSIYLPKTRRQRETLYSLKKRHKSVIVLYNLTYDDCPTAYMYTYMCINILLSKKTERLSDFRFISTCIYLMKIKLLKIKLSFYSAVYFF